MCAIAVLWMTHSSIIRQDQTNTVIAYVEMFCSFSTGWFLGIYSHASNLTFIAWPLLFFFDYRVHYSLITLAITSIIASSRWHTASIGCPASIRGFTRYRPPVSSLYTEPQLSLQGLVGEAHAVPQMTSHLAPQTETLCYCNWRYKSFFKWLL